MAALTAPLLRGREAGVAASTVALARCGGGAFKAEVEVLSSSLAGLAALQEAVHGGVWEALAARAL